MCVLLAIIIILVVRGSLVFTLTTAIGGFGQQSDTQADEQCKPVNV